MKVSDGTLPDAVTATLEIPADAAHARDAAPDLNLDREVGGLRGVPEDSELAERMARLAGFFEGFEEGIIAAMELARDSSGDTDWIQF